MWSSGECLSFHIMRFVRVFFFKCAYVMEVCVCVCLYLFVCLQLLGDWLVRLYTDIHNKYISTKLNQLRENH